MSGHHQAEIQAARRRFFVYFGVYLVELTGTQLAVRFSMPMSVILQLGIAVYVLDIISDRHDRSGRGMLLGILAAGVAIFQILYPTDFGLRKSDSPGTEQGLYQAAQILTNDIPDGQQVGVDPDSAWPVVATGQRVVSVPWPEPMIFDLAERQAATVSLFSTDTSAADRVALATAYGVRVLIANRAFLSDDVFAQLQQQAVSTATSGPLIRFDLYD